MPQRKSRGSSDAAGGESACFSDSRGLTLNIIVCVKSVPGIITGLNISDAGDRLEPKVRLESMNESDEYALEEALVLRKENGGTVTAITAGPASSEEIMRTALAKGADKALRVDMSSNDPVITSVVLAEAIRKMDFALILTGLESGDNLAAQVGIATAERLNIPFLFAATRIEIISAGKAARVTKEIGGAIHEVLDIRLPALVCTQTGIQKLTYAPVAKLFQARRQGVPCVNISDFGLSKEQLEATTRWKFLEVVKPEKRHTAELIRGTPAEIAPGIIARIKEVL